MLQIPGCLRRSNAFLLALAVATAGCAAGAASRKPAAKPPVFAPLVARATDQFALGREAALSGDFVCAQEYFRQALDTLRPAGAPPTADPELLAFSLELFESVLRYEALAGPAEEAGTSDGKISPELAGIESPRTTEQALTHAQESVASDTTEAAHDIPIVVNEPVLRVLAAFQDKFSGVISRGLGRSGRYMPMIQRIFEEEGIPKDLAQVALIESSFLTNARSPMSAHGIWQFMPRTGRHYGLSSNAVVDERSDPEKSTRAAAKYLAYLYELFGDWYLAMAAYNAGEGKILRAMRRTGAKDFWELSVSGAIRPQTANYVPAVIAATLIARNPVHYGFEVFYEPPLEYETVSLDRPVDLRHLVAGGELPLETLKLLNPELRTAITPREPRGYELKVPPGTRESVLLAFAGAPTAQLPSLRRHVVRRGDTLAKVARRYGVTVARLASANSLSRRAGLKRGRSLIIPGRANVVTASARKGKKSRPAETRIASAKTRSPKARTAKSYRVRGGDTLYRIALRHGTTVARILAINSLSHRQTIRPGDRLKIPARSR